MTQFLPHNLLALFAPRDPIPYLPPASKLPHEKKNRGYVGIGDFLAEFEDPKDTPPPTRVETREERVERRRRERAEQVAYKLEQEIAIWDPNSQTNVTSDPFKTLFVARINYDTSESKLRREFEVYGPIKKIILIHNTVNGKPRGYAFIEYEHERDMHSAYKHADGKKIDGRRVLVDVERARTVKGWLPRRLGGGLGGTRRGGPDVNIKHSGREDNERERERYRLEREREERGGGRDRERVGLGGGNFERRRSRSRERRKRSRSRSPRREKRRRSRDRARGEGGDVEEVDRRSRERDRDRDRDRERKRRRSKSRDRDRERKRERRERRERERGEKLEYIKTDEKGEVRIKEEPFDDYPDYSQYQQNYDQTNVKYEEEDEHKYEPEPPANNGAARHYEEDDYEEDPAPLKGGYRIIIASNRDEFYRRPAKGAFHSKESGLIGGRDMEQDRENGMWLGITVNPLNNIKLRFGALLNVTGEERKTGVQGRGPIVRDYLIGNDVATSYNDKLQNTNKAYNAFNFVSIELSADDLKTYHHSNAPYDTKVYNGKQLLGFGNSTTEHPLQKVVMGKKRFADIIKDANHVSKQEELCNELLKLLKWEEKHVPDKELEKRAPNTVEQLSQVFVKFPEAGYGTRTHTVVLVDDEWNVEFLESTMKEPIDPNNPIWDTVKIKSRL